MNLFCFTLCVLAGLLTRTATAQDVPLKSPGFTISVFSHSVSLPTFQGFFKSPNFGVRVGTEFYYRNRTGSQLIQTLNIGAYHHRSLQNSLYVNTEFGYRKVFGGFYAEGFVGMGSLGILQSLRSYERTEMGDFRPAPRFMVRIMPSVSAGVGYHFRPHTGSPLSVFTRYEFFGEAPFSNRSVPLLPHSALHLGARFPLSH